MITLLIVLLSGLIVGLFATQNTQNVSIFFAQYTLNEIPLYIVVMGALIFGIAVSWLISTVGSISSLLTIHSKNKKINEGKAESVGLTKKVHQLELENERLKAELNKPGDEKSL
jgi:lipopolysaccharide assembly protein A